MRTLPIFLLFLIFSQAAGALMVSPAKATGDTKITITNNAGEEADYRIAGKCADADEDEFALNPSERKEVHAKIKCKGYLTITEETRTAINKLNIQIDKGEEPEEKANKSLWKPVLALLAVITALLLAGLKLLKKEAKATLNLRRR